MVSRAIVCLCAMFLYAAAGSAGTCSVETLARAIDVYAKEPFGARSWRVLQGLGDPMVDAAAPGGDTWSAQERWKALASRIMPDETGLQSVAWNCRIAYPLSVLEKRLGSLGSGHIYVRQWLKSQVKVLQACASDDAADIALPPPVDIEPAFVNLQRLDRAYQEASIAFYRNRERALPLFRAIAASGSPHRAAARYNVANLLANARQPDAARAEAAAILADPSLASVHAIVRELLGYIANQEDTADGWTGVIERAIAVIQSPREAVLAGDDSRRDYAGALYDIDFAGVRGKRDDGWLDGTLPADATLSKALVDTSRRHPMVLWMMGGQSLNEPFLRAPWGMIGPRWQERASTYVARVLAIAPAGEGIAGAAGDMLEALAARPDAESRAWLWARADRAMAAAEASCGTAPDTAAAGFLLFHAVRLSAMAGEYDEALAGLEKVSFDTSESYARTLLRLAQHAVGQGDATQARRMRDRLIEPRRGGAPALNAAVSDELAEILALIAEDDARWTAALHRHSDPASNLLLDFLPTRTLWAFADDDAWSAPERALFARAAWTRDFALGRALSQARTRRLESLNPAIGEIAASVDRDYPGAKAENRRLLTILRSPRHNILVSMPTGWRPQSLTVDDFAGLDSWDRNDKNWWCPLEPDRLLAALRRQVDVAMGTVSVPDQATRTLKDVYDADRLDSISRGRDAILKRHPAVAAMKPSEVRALTRMPSAPRRLAEAALRWAKASKGSDGAPEALALAVRATRYGCSWHGSHERYSKAAQQLLASKFGATDWAQRTPYWFGCQRQEYTASGVTEAVCAPKSWPRQPPLK